MKQLKYPIWLGIIILLVGCVIVICYCNRDDQKIIMGVKVAGISLGGLTLEAAEELLEEKTRLILGRTINFYAPHYLMKMSLADLGLRFDLKATANQAYLFGRSGSFWAKINLHRLTKQKEEEIMPEIFFEKQILNKFLLRVEQELTVYPVRAAVTVNSQGKISYTKEQFGQVVERDKLLARIKAAIMTEEVLQIKIPLAKVNPTLTLKEIKSWNLDNILGLYTTSYNQNNFDREHNIINAATAIDNVLIFSGQIFSFNSWVGPRLSLTGYREAPIIYQGKLIMGVGGGVCQVSSTLYNAVLLANLSVLKRINHSLASGYIPLARDAAVADGVVDFSFKNTLETPILIVAKVQKGQLALAILGKNHLWSKVELKTVVLEEQPFEIIETPDPTQLLGERIEIQTGKTGYKAELWRIIHYNDGEIKQEKINTSIYKPQAAEFRIGTKTFTNQ